MLVRLFSGDKMRILIVLFIAVVAIPFATAQQEQSQDTASENAKQSTSKKDKKQATPANAIAPDKSAENAKAAESPKADSEATDKEEHYDVAEVPPVVTHHQIMVNGKSLSYTATTGRLPLKRDDGKIEAEMFFVAYTLDGQEAGSRPLTFAFNGGPGSACPQLLIVWKTIPTRFSTAVTS
jgi:carboxypeptidase C (cathepsin A)